MHPVGARCAAGALERGLDTIRNLRSAWTFALAGCAIGALTAAPAPGAQTYVLAVAPSAPPVTMHTLWQPFVERVARDTGLDLRLRVFERMSDFERDLSRGVGDFVFSNPLQCVVGHQLQGYVPLVRGSTPVSARLFVRRDSPVTSVDALAGKRIAFVGNKSFCSIFTRDQISRHGEPMWFEQEYEGSSENVVLSVLRGKADAGAAFFADLEKEPREHREQIRAVLQTPSVASHPISAHPRVPESAREAVRRAVLSLASDAKAARLLEKLRLASPVVADYGKDYQALETVDVRGLSSWGE